MRRILVAVDDSPASGRAVTFVNAFFRDEDISITAVNVARVPVEWIPPTPYGGLMPWPWGPDGAGLMPEDAIERAEEEATAVVAEQAPVDADVEVVFGETVEAIERAAEETGADLIVVGSNHKGVVQRAIEGSVSERLARETSRPLLVVP
jgi:nucleotide-binding universal stress UspA family protein